MNDRYLYKAKIKGNLTGHEELDWVIGNLIVEQSTGRHFIVDLSHFDDNTKLCDVVIEVDQSTICQCTGLKDKNGKLIWENDIVRYTDMITGTEKIDRIEWNETHASFVRLHRSQMGLQYLYIDELIANGCEVIGNIFDNPELLEVGE